MGIVMGMLIKYYVNFCLCKFFFLVVKVFRILEIFFRGNRFFGYIILIFLLFCSLICFLCWESGGIDLRFYFL